MSGGKLTAAGLESLMRETAEPTIRHENTVLRECLEVAMRELTFAAMPTSRQALRAIRARLLAASIEVSA